MGKSWAVVAVLVSWIAPGIISGDEPLLLPADFKIQVSSFRLGEKPVSTEEIVIREGRAYLFPSDSKELIVIEPNRKRLELVDVGRKVQTEVSFQSLDESLGKIKVSLREAADAREKLGGRANTLEAKMTRDLFETKLTMTPGSKPNRIRLATPAVEVDAVGEPEEDAPRLAMVAEILESIAKFGAFRAPEDLPPFSELEAIASLARQHRLRPTELSYLYRLNGPPRKFRRTYKLVPTLTDRDVAAIARVDRLREAVPSLRYERYRPSR